MIVCAYGTHASVPSAEAQVVCATGLVGLVFLRGLKCQRIANLRILLPFYPKLMEEFLLAYGDGDNCIWKRKEGMAVFGILIHSF